MSEIASAWPEPETTGFPRKYPWESWTDGQIHICTRGVDFDVEPRRFARSAWMHADRHGLRVETTVRGRSVFLQFKPKPRRPLRDHNATHNEPTAARATHPEWRD